MTARISSFCKILQNNSKDLKGSLINRYKLLVLKNNKQQLCLKEKRKN